MPKTTLEIFSERREPTLLLDPSGYITTMERLTKGVYREIVTFENVIEYAKAIPPDTSEEYLHQVDAGALLDHTDHYYEKVYNNLRAVIGYVGIELTLRYTTNGARFSTLQSKEGRIHSDERFLAVSPSIYYAVNDASDAINNRDRDEMSADSY